jgi:hypothetical protein
VKERHFLRRAIADDFREELEEVVNELLVNWGWTPSQVRRAVTMAIRRSQSLTAAEDAI